MKILRFLLVLLVLIVAGVIALPFLLPANVIADQVAKITRQQTGRDLNLGGDISFSVYPNIAVSMDDISISNPASMPEGVVLAANQLRISLALMPLLSGDVQVNSFELVEPRFNLLVDSEGRSNWSFENAEDGNDSGRGSRENASSDEPSGTTDSSGTPVRNVSLEDVRIVDGIVRYLDETTGDAFEVRGVNVSLSLPSLDDDLTLNGSVDWQGETVTLDSVLGPVSQLSEERIGSVDVQLSSTHLTASYRGGISLVNGFVLDGDVEASSPSIRSLAGWAGNPLAPGNGLGAFEVTAALRMAPDEISLSEAQIALDGMRGQGAVTIGTGGARPRITANLGVDQINLNTYLGGSGSGSEGGSGGGSGWSNDPIDVSGLSAVDAELRLAATQLIFQQVTTGNVLASVTLESGRLDAQVEQLSLYDGNATGFVQLDGSSGTAVISAGLDADRISANPFLNDFADFDWIEGAAQMSVRVNGAGNSQAAIVSSLAGNAQMLFTDGAIRGINIASMMRNLTGSILNGWERSDSQKTDFASLSATYQINQGIAVNNDLAMIGPLVRLTGAGTVNMPSQYIDYKVEPKLVASLEGQGGVADLTGFNVPIIIKGPWSNPDIYPDIAGILTNPEQALQQLELLGDIDTSNIGETVDNVLDNVVGDDAASQVEDVLDDVLGEDGGSGLNDLLQGLTGDN